MLLSLLQRLQYGQGVLWDNVQLSTNVGVGAVAASDTIGGVDFQRIKLISGADGTNDGDVAKGNPLHIRQSATTSTLTNTADNAASVTVLASNANRQRAFLFNDSTAVASVKYGVTASATSFTKKMFPGEFFVVECYTGIIDCIWASAPGGAMRATEITA